MSMSIKKYQNILLSGLPVILLLIAVGLVAWKTMQVEIIPTGSRLTLHQAFRNVQERNALPADSVKPAQDKKPAARDPFFRHKIPVKEEFQPVNIKENYKLVEITLTTIAQGTRGNYCMVNGKIFHEGQTGDGFSVEKIESDRVIFSTSGESFVVEPGQKLILESGGGLDDEAQTNRAKIEMISQ